MGADLPALLFRGEAVGPAAAAAVSELLAAARAKLPVVFGDGRVAQTDIEGGSARICRQTG